jgi:hypothetical protein
LDLKIQVTCSFKMLISIRTIKPYNPEDRIHQSPLREHARVYKI